MIPAPTRLVLATLLAGAPAGAQLEPDFDSQTVSGSDPPQVAFEDLSTGAVVDAWHWDFGDGGTSTLQEPTHTYAWPGQYAVTLTVSSGAEQESTTRTVYPKPVFDQVLVASSTFAAERIEAADVDGDGDVDLFVLDDEGLVRWLENTAPLGTFGAEHVVIDPPGTLKPRDLVAADLDGDVDVAYCWAATVGDTARLLWHENPGDGTGTWPTHLVEDSTSLFGPLLLDAADVDGDGDTDLVVGLYGTPDGSSAIDLAAWYENTDGDGSFGPVQPVTSVGWVQDVVAADADADGDVDVVVLEHYDGVHWHRNADGLGTFEGPLVVHDDITLARALAAADLDGDGDDDLVVTTSGTMRWFENIGGADPGFGPEVPVAGGSGAVVHAADLDADGDEDLVTGPWFLDDPVEWVQSNGDGTLELPIVAGAAGVTSTDVAADDFDGDGDLVVALPSAQRLELYRSRLQWGLLEGATPGAAGTPRLTGAGALQTGSPLTLALDRAPAATPFLLWMSFVSSPLDVLGGTLHAFPRTSQVSALTDGAGAWALSLTWPPVAAGVDFWLQAIVQDTSVPAGLTLSNGLRAQTH